KSKGHGLKTKDYLQLLTIYYMCDAGSYKALGYHFDLQGDTMKFSQETQSKVDQLVRCTTREFATSSHHPEILENLAPKVADIMKTLQPPAHLREYHAR